MNMMIININRESREEKRRESLGMSSSSSLLVCSQQASAACPGEVAECIQCPSSLFQFIYALYASIRCYFLLCIFLF